MEQETLILNHDQIMEKTRRIAWQIYENNHEENEVVLIGIPNRGLIFSELILNELASIADFTITSGKVDLQPDGTGNISVDVEGKSVVLVDDVLNSGNTLMKAASAIMDLGPKQLRTAILANRDHKLYPIAADFVGISLATTLQEHISFKADQPDQMTVTLQ